MSEKIAPALSAEEWADARDPLYGANLGEHVLIGIRPGALAIDSEFGNLLAPAAKVLALANAALPDDDPRKITCALVERLRESATEAADGYSGPWWLNGLADALESYLPPDK